MLSTAEAFQLLFTLSVFFLGRSDLTHLAGFCYESPGPTWQFFLNCVSPSESSEETCALWKGSETIRDMWKCSKHILGLVRPRSSAETH